MNLHYRVHPCDNLETYIAASTNHENYAFANAMMYHFNRSSGVFSMREFEQFKIFVTLHTHNVMMDV